MQGPYVFINDRPQLYPQLKLSLSLSPHAQTKFDTLNQHIRNTVVLPGQLVIIGDSRTASCTAEEARLMLSARNVKHDLMAHSAADQSLIKNYDLLQAIMAHTSIGIGAASSAWSKHLAAIEKTLMEIEDLHKQYLRKGTMGARDEFLVKRRALFAKLEIQLSGMARFGAGLKNEETVKRIAKASQMLKKGTYIGIALDVGVTALEITEACSTGREQECTRAKFVEGGKLVLGVGGAAYRGYAGMGFGVAVCAAVFAIPTAGVSALGCAIVGGAVGGLAVGTLGSHTGEQIGTLLYEVSGSGQ